MKNKGSGEIFSQIDEEVNELLRHIEHENLKAFATQYAYRQPTFKKDILEYFNAKNTGKSIAEYRENAFGSFSFEGTGMYKRGYDYYDAAQDAADELNTMLEKANYFISKGN